MRKIALLAPLSAPLLASAAGPNLLSNGGFENLAGAALEGWGGYTYGAGYSQPMAGWTVDTGSVDIVHKDTAWGPASEGNFSLDINGWDAGKITSNSFATVVGQIYTVSFDYSRNVYGSADFVATANAGGQSLVITTQNDTGTYGTPYHMKWVSTGFQFKAQEELTTLSFTANTQGNAGVFLDNVSVTAAVPEPETYALMLAGLAAVGFVARRRKSA